MTTTELPAFRVTGPSCDTDHERQMRDIPALWAQAASEGLVTPEGDVWAAYHRYDVDGAAFRLRVTVGRADGARGEAVDVPAQRYLTLATDGTVAGVQAAWAQVWEGSADRAFQVDLERWRFDAEGRPAHADVYVGLRGTMIREATRVDYEARIGEVLTFVEAHLDEELSPERLARVAHFSGYHFHRVFRGITGESVMEHVRRLRLERAARRLRTTDASVTEVAFEAGFSSHEAFTRAFAARFGAPPRSFRDRDGPRIEALRARGRLTPPEQVEVRTTRPRRFLYARGVGSYADVGAAWVAFLVEARRTGAYTGAETLVGRYPDDPEITPAGRVRFDVGLVCGDDRPAGPLREDHLPGGTWAVALHRGGYATLSETYLRLVGGWFVASGRALADGPCLEVYLHPPETTDEALLRTEVWAPIG